MANKKDDAKLKCSFCGKTQQQVRKLIAGPNVYICDQCIEFCNTLLFDDESGKTNLSLSDVGGELLLVSQFTLYANCKKGHRPSFMEAGKPEHAKALYEYMLTKANDYCDVVQHGSFGAHMHVSLVGNGPFTIVLDSKELLGC